MKRLFAAAAVIISAFIVAAAQPGFRRNERTFFIKMSYLFRESFGG